jgi:hypothetical protein
LGNSAKKKDSKEENGRKEKSCNISIEEEAAMLVWYILLK